MEELFGCLEGGGFGGVVGRGMKGNGLAARRSGRDDWAIFESVWLWSRLASLCKLFVLRNEIQEGSSIYVLSHHLHIFQEFILAIECAFQESLLSTISRTEQRNNHYSCNISKLIWYILGIYEISSTKGR